MLRANLPNFRNNWVFLDSKQLANGTGHDISDKINDGKKVVLFCTLQDIEGDEKKAKHAEIYKFAKESSCLIVDETHNKPSPIPSGDEAERSCLRPCLQFCRLGA